MQNGLQLEPALSIAHFIIRCMFQISVSLIEVMLTCRNSWGVYWALWRRESQGEGAEGRADYDIPLNCIGSIWDIRNQENPRQVHFPQILGSRPWSPAGEPAPTCPEHLPRVDPVGVALFPTSSPCWAGCGSDAPEGKLPEGSGAHVAETPPSRGQGGPLY